MSYKLSIEPEALRKLSEDEQIEIMRDWFFENYQNPNEECPYDQEEGDYVYIWGGPYIAYEELECEFGEYVNEKIIQKLADELENICYEWSAISSQEFESSEDILDWSTEYENAIDRFNKNITSIENLLKSIDDNDVIIKQMIHAYCISILEAFLSEEFMYNIFNDEAYLQKLFENENSDFKRDKITLSEIFFKMKNVKKIAMEYLSNILWHNLKKISLLYKNVLGIEFPNDIGFLYNEIEKRHDIVHRCGRNKEGVEIKISKENIKKLIIEIKRLVNYINGKTDTILF